MSCLRPDISKFLTGFERDPSVSCYLYKGVFVFMQTKTNFVVGNLVSCLVNGLLSVC